MTINCENKYTIFENECRGNRVIRKKFDKIEIKNKSYLK
jgi:hypothetical protein